LLIGATGRVATSKIDPRLNVARLANLPEEVISIAGEKSRIMEEETKAREAQRWYQP
jgi:hypothetical protein